MPCKRYYGNGERSKHSSRDLLLSPHTPYLKYAGFVIIVGLLSSAVHEGVHWIQLSLSREFYPGKIVFTPPNSWLVNGDYREYILLGAIGIEVRPRYEMPAGQFYALLNQQRARLETEAYLMQGLFVLLLFWLAYKKHWIMDEK